MHIIFIGILLWGFYIIQDEFAKYGMYQLISYRVHEIASLIPLLCTLTTILCIGYFLWCWRKRELDKLGRTILLVLAVCFCLEMGYFKTKEDYKSVFDKIENALGYDRLCSFHSHFSKIEYTTGGEKKHLTFADTIYGPDFEPVLDLVVQKNCSPTFICESDGTQAEDVRKMKDYYCSIR